MADPTNYETMPDPERWPTFIDEYGLPTLRQWVRARWLSHVQDANNGDNISGMWDNGYESSPYWSLARSTDLTHWGLGVIVSHDVWGKRWDVALHLGPVGFGLSREEKVS